MLEHHHDQDRPADTAAVPEDQAHAEAGDGDQVRPASAVPVPPAPAGDDSYRPARRPVPAAPRRTSKQTENGTGTASQPAAAPGTVPAAAEDLADLLPAARAAADTLNRDGRPLTRDALASQLRQAGHPVRNARLTPLIQALRQETPAAA